MNEAMTRIRYELGTDAVIISQRKIRKPGIKGLFSSKIIEVTAAVENQVVEQDQTVVSSFDSINKVVEQEIAIKENAIKNNERQSQKQNSIVHRDSQYVEGKSETRSDNYSESIMNEMMKMKTMISELADVNKPMNNTKSDIEKILEENDIDSENIENIVMKIKNIKLESQRI